MGLGKWDIEIRTEFTLDNEVNKRVSFLQYQHSNIPLFPLLTTKLIKEYLSFNINIPTFHYSMYEA